MQLLPNKACLRGVQLLQNKADNMGSTFTIYCKARFRIFPTPPPSAAVLGGSNFRLVRLDLGPVQDFGIPVREHSARIKTSKNEFWGGQNPHFFSACRRQCPPRGARHAIARPPGTGTQHGEQLLQLYGPVRSFYKISLHSRTGPAFTK